MCPPLLTAAMTLALALAALPGGGVARPLTVFAAASLKGPLDAALERFERATGRDAVASYAATSALARQIEHGAPADVFVSADREWMDYLDARGLIDASSRRDLLGNALVLVIPTDRRMPMVQPRDPFDFDYWLRGGRLAVAETASVPAGRYAKAALQALGRWDAVRERLAESDNVRSALAFVARGEAPAGIVYASDAAAEPRVRVVATFPPGSHPPIVYPAARVAASDDADALALLRFLGRDATDVFADAGFRILAE